MRPTFPGLVRVLQRPTLDGSDRELETPTFDGSDRDFRWLSLKNKRDLLLNDKTEN